jgi:putative phosphoribosyl transferase
VFAFANVMHLFPDELAGLGRRRLSFSSVLPRSSHRFSLGHCSLHVGVDRRDGKVRTGMTSAARSVMQFPFRDRAHAGRQLAAKLEKYARRSDAIVLALPRGGVPVAFEVATALDLPLDVFVVRKLGVPSHEEFAMGALASGGARVLDEEIVRLAGLSRADVDRVTARERVELERRERLYRGTRPFPKLAGMTVLLIDDGLATGSTMRVAVQALRRENPARIVVAVPVASSDTCDAFRDIADEIVCAATPEPFRAVGLWYTDFSQTTDQEVHALLHDARAADRRRAADDGQPSRPAEPSSRQRRWSSDARIR